MFHQDSNAFVLCFKVKLSSNSNSDNGPLFLSKMIVKLLEAPEDQSNALVTAPEEIRDVRVWVRTLGAKDTRSLFLTIGYCFYCFFPFFLILGGIIF